MNFIFAYCPYHCIQNLEMEVTNLPKQVNHMEIKHDEVKVNKLLSWYMSFQSISVISALRQNENYKRTAKGRGGLPQQPFYT